MSLNPTDSTGLSEGPTIPSLSTLSVVQLSRPEQLRRFPEIRGMHDLHFIYTSITQAVKQRQSRSQKRQTRQTRIEGGEIFVSLFITSYIHQMVTFSTYDVQEASKEAELREIRSQSRRVEMEFPTRHTKASPGVEEG
ncbi:uncharacterized [Tachysurus ichikawai]